MGFGSYQLLLLVGAGCIVGAYSKMYISNATDILYTANLKSQPKSIYHNSNSRIVGVAEDDGYVFWSDIGYDSRGIYRASVSGLNQVTDVMKIVSDDVGEVNGLAVDWLKKHIYWTDSTKLSIEVAKYDGSVRHVLPIFELKTPRGIAVDPENGYLYWNDQGTKKIEQSFLDGSNRTTVAESSVGTSGPNLPNQMIVKGRKLYYVDAYNLNVVEYDVSQSTPIRRVVAANLRGSGASSSSYPYGLDLDDVYVYVSIGFTGKVVKMPLDASASPTALFQNLGVDAIFSLTGVSSKPTTSSPSCSCSGGICLQNSISTSRCVCPSLGNDSPKTPSANKQACQTPTNVLFYVIAETGVVGYRDLEGPSDDENLYIVGRSSRPVAVTYDPVTQFVYWSDVQERSVHKAKINGANHSIFMNSFTHSLGVVDGLAMDPVNRNLYYTNMGSVEVQSFVHRWHKIELINLDGKGRKTIVESAEKPRGLYVDGNANKLYYTDWGDKPAVVQVNLDGSNPEAIRTSGLDNPNAVTIIGDWIYVADSHYKTRDPLNQNYPRSSRNGAVYKVKKDGTMWQEVSSFNPKTPFGMTSFGSHLYVSDWDSKSIQKVSTAGSSSTFIQNFNTPMSVYFSIVTASPSSNPCSSQGCSELCILGKTEKCTCDSYNANTSPSASSKTCAIPGQFILVGDFNAIKLVSQDGTATPGTTHLVEPQAAIAGSSYFANFVALAYNTATGQLYYSDVNRKSIYESKLDGKDPMLVYNGSQIADGMDLHGGKLYWTAFTEGKIYSTDLSTNQTSVVISGLSRPRAIKVAKSRIYWSEWGTRPRVASVPLLNTADITTHTDNVTRP